MTGAQFGNGLSVSQAWSDGRLTSKRLFNTSSGTNLSSLTYNRTGDPAQTNVYNGLDDRVSVDSAGTTRVFVYDPDGRVIGEYGTSASDVIAETIWLQPEVANDNQPIGGDDGVGGYAPLALATGSGGSAALYWVHGNHLGVPLTTSNASGAAVAPTGTTMPGYPGQQRTLADLYYNRYRDYDSSTGRYIQADPTGLGGGSNPYLYAEGNPLRYVDPWGLKVSASDVAKFTGEQLLKDLLQPTNISKRTPWIAIGTVCGTVLGATAWYLNQDDDDRCRPYYDEIRKRADVLRRRLIQFRQNDLELPESNPPGVKGRTRAGEAQSFYDAQAGLRRAINNALAAGCTNIPPDASRLATMPLDSRYPRPTGKYSQ